MLSSDLVNYVFSINIYGNYFQIPVSNMTFITEGVKQPSVDIPASKSCKPFSKINNTKTSSAGLSNRLRPKILVTYASGYGSTAEVAQEIAKCLSETGATATIHQLPFVENLDQFDAVIIGSPIRYDRWMPDARNFVITNQELLSNLPIAFFFNCLTLVRLTDETKRKANQYADKLFALSPQVKPISVGQFAGVLDYSKMPFFLSLVFKIFGSIMGLPEGDYRDWSAIHRWTQDVAIKFSENMESIDR